MADTEMRVACIRLANAALGLHDCLLNDKSVDEAVAVLRDQIVQVLLTVVIPLKQEKRQEKRKESDHG